MGCCGVPSITLLNDPGGDSGVKGKEQNAGVGQEFSKKISYNSSSKVGLLHPAMEGLSLVLLA